MSLIRPLLLLAALFSLSGCADNVFKAPDNSDCDFFGNCKCDEWYDSCSLHDSWY